MFTGIIRNGDTLKSLVHVARKKKKTNTCEVSEKVGLKFNIQKMKIMASGPITSGK